MDRGLRPLILASASPRRRELLKRLKIPFRVVPSNVSEACRAKNPRLLVVTLARRKALAISKRHSRRTVLGADTVVVCDGKIIGKPRDKRQALGILRQLNGRWHSVFTGVAVAWDGGSRILSRAVRTMVKARRLPPETLFSFAGKHLDKAGAYALQDRKDPFINRIRGPRDNVLGLPLKAVRELLKRADRSALLNRARVGNSQGQSRLRNG